MPSSHCASTKKCRGWKSVYGASVIEVVFEGEGPNNPYFGLSEREGFTVQKRNDLMIASFISLYLQYAQAQANPWSHWIVRIRGLETSVQDEILQRMPDNIKAREMKKPLSSRSNTTYSRIRVVTAGLREKLNVTRYQLTEQEKPDISL